MTLDVQEPFLAALAQHKGILFKVAHAYCHRREDRSDLIQETIAELWGAWPRYDGRAKVSTWIYRVAMNVAISAYRREGRRIRDALPIDEFGLNIAAADRVMDSEDDDLRSLHQFIARLDEINRALVLLYLDGYNQSEIAEMLGISVTNVTTRMHRTKQRLRRDHAAEEGK